MCRYYYRDGLCASGSVEDRKCIGLEQCSESSGAFKASPDKSCGHDRWYGLYCDKYKKFFCSGVGKCETFEDYMKSFVEHVSSARNAGPSDEMQL